MDINLPDTARDSRGSSTVSESSTRSKSGLVRLQVSTSCMGGISIVNIPIRCHGRACTVKGFRLVHVLVTSVAFHLCV